MPMINLRLFCDQLSKDLEMSENIKEEAPGIFSLPIEEDISIKIGTMPEGFSLFCLINELPKENTENFLSEVMNANLFGYITRNSVLGLSEEGNRLTLSRTIDYNIDYKGFSDLLQDFYNIVLFWKEQCVSNLNKK